MTEQERSVEAAPWRGEPWPLAEVRGELERAGREWLHTNGTGAYAMSTVPLMHTRRHHGMLVAALAPPLDRYVVLSHAETKIESATGKQFMVNTHQFPAMAPTPGYRHLQLFAQDPIPRWLFKWGKLGLERTLCLVQGRNAVVLSYTWLGRWPAKLTLKPLMALRPIRQLQREHGAMVQRVNLRRGEVEIQPVPHLPPVSFGHAGVFVGSPAWWRQFEYTDDPQRNEPSTEDLWSPGHFELVLEPGRPTHLVVAWGELPREPPERLIAQTVSALLATDPGPDRPLAVRALSVAAEQFLALQAPRPAIITGYPFYDIRTRDTLVALVGLLLARWRVADAQRVLAELVKELHAGLLPERLPEQPGEVAERSADATLWLFEAVRELTLRTGTEDDFLRQELYPALRRVFVRIRSGKEAGISLTEDGLLANRHPTAAMTWMAARAGAQLVTPRRGLAVELQALWARACRTLAELARELGDEVTLEAATVCGGAAREAFKARFWNEALNYPYDCVSERPGEAPDPSLRPNALIALVVEPYLFERWQAAAIVERVRRQLLTTRGVRSLEPSHPDYLGVHVGPPEERQSSYHQGTAWTYLIGFYARAALRLEPEDFELREALRALVEQTLADGPVLGQVAQLADGDEPHRPRGCPAQAWSVAELLRTLVCELGL